MRLRRITPPVVEPVSLAELKAHLRIDTADEDAVLSGLLTAAREYCENFQNMSYGSQEWEVSFDEPPDMPIMLPRPPVTAITSIKVVGADGVEYVVPSSDYVLTIDALAFLPGKTWPDVRPLAPLDAVRIRYTAGYSASLVPDSVKLAIKLLAGHWYEHREAVAVGAVSREMEFAVSALLWQTRIVPSPRG